MSNRFTNKPGDDEFSRGEQPSGSSEAELEVSLRELFIPRETTHHNLTAHGAAEVAASFNLFDRLEVVQAAGDAVIQGHTLNFHSISELLESSDLSRVSESITFRPIDGKWRGSHVVDLVPERMPPVWLRLEVGDSRHPDVPKRLNMTVRFDYGVTSREYSAKERWELIDQTTEPGPASTILISAARRGPIDALQPLIVECGPNVVAEVIGPTCELRRDTSSQESRLSSNQIQSVMISGFPSETWPEMVDTLLDRPLLKKNMWQVIADTVASERARISPFGLDGSSAHVPESLDGSDTPNPSLEFSRTIRRGGSHDALYPWQLNFNNLLTSHCGAVSGSLVFSESNALLVYIALPDGVEPTSIHSLINSLVTTAAGADGSNITSLVYPKSEFETGRLVVKID